MQLQSFNEYLCKYNVCIKKYADIGTQILRNGLYINTAPYSSDLSTREYVQPSKV
jgi:hypothetical protein